MMIPSSHQNWHQHVIAMPGHLLRRCQQIAVALFLDECAVLNLTPLQFVVLSALVDYGPCDQATVGRFTAIDRTTAQVVIDNLSKLGLVTRTKSRTDKRAKVIEVTQAGHKLTRTALPLVERAQRRILAPLTKRERSALIRLLNKLAKKNNAESRAPYRAPSLDSRDHRKVRRVPGKPHLVSPDKPHIKTGHVKAGFADGV